VQNRGRQTAKAWLHPERHSEASTRRRGEVGRDVSRVHIEVECWSVRFAAMVFNSDSLKGYTLSNGPAQ